MLSVAPQHETNDDPLTLHYSAPKGITVTPPLRSECGYTLVLGYILTTSFLEAYARKHKRCKIRTELQRQNAHTYAISHIQLQADVVAKSRLWTVYTGKIREDRTPVLESILALGSNRSERRRQGPKPYDEVIRRVQQVLETDAPPMWYRRF